MGPPSQRTPAENELGDNGLTSIPYTSDRFPRFAQSLSTSLDGSSREYPHLSRCRFFNRAKVVAECTLKESAAINQILGKRWHKLSREEQFRYYEMARKERQLHMQMYPGWTARDNYALNTKKKKRKKERILDAGKQFGDGQTTLRLQDYSKAFALPELFRESASGSGFDHGILPMAMGPSRFPPKAPLPASFLLATPSP